MALSGSLATSSYDGRYYRLDWTAKQSVANNRSTISWTLKAIGGNHNWYAEHAVIVKLNGVELWSRSTRVERYESTVKTGTFTIDHDTNGEATFSMSVSAAVYESSYNCVSDVTKFTLTTISRRSTISAIGGTLALNSETTITVKRNSNSLTHTIIAKCGDRSLTVCEDSTATSVTFTPPIKWAEVNSKGLSVVITYTITTSYGSEVIGSVSYDKQYSIPEDLVTPTMTVGVTDSEGYDSTYGGFVQGMSKLNVTANVSCKYGSTVKECSSTLLSKKYLGTSFTSEILDKQGTATLVTTVKDSRGLSVTVETNIEVIQYARVNISSMSINRSTDGNSLIMSFSGVGYQLDGLNAFSGVLKYRKTGETDYTSVDILVVNDSDTAISGTHTFSADAASTYEVLLAVNDNFTAAQKSGYGKTVVKLFSILRSQMGIAFGKIAELADVFDIGFKTRFSGGILQPVLSNGVNFNDLLTPNTYSGDKALSSGFINCPVMSDCSFVLEVLSIGSNGEVLQRITDLDFMRVYERTYNGIGFGVWIRRFGVDLYSNASGSNGTITLTEDYSKFKYLDIFFSDTNGIDGGFTRVYCPFSSIVDLSLAVVGTTSVMIRRTRYTLSGTTLTPSSTNRGNTQINNAAASTTTDANYLKINRVVGYEYE